MDESPPLLTRKRWLLVQALRAGASLFVAIEAVASTAMEHPDWDMSEEKTWDEWEASK